MKTTEWEKNKAYESSNRMYQQNKRVFLSMLEDSGGELLDLGCQDGSFTKVIAKKVGAKRAYGIDLDDERIIECEKKGIIAKKCDLNGKLPFEDGKFDVVSAHQTLEHLWNTKNFFTEVNRILKPGGYAVISTPNLSSLHSIAFILVGWQPTILHLTDTQVGNPLRGTQIEQPGHNKAFNISSLHDLADIHGFKTEKIIGFGFHFLPMTLQKALSKPFGRWAVFLTTKIRKIG
jgi:SAM-dependent methyltransferase